MFLSLEQFSGVRLLNLHFVGELVFPFSTDNQQSDTVSKGCYLWCSLVWGVLLDLLNKSELLRREINSKSIMFSLLSRQPRASQISSTMWSPTLVYHRDANQRLMCPSALKAQGAQFLPVLRWSDHNSVKLGLFGFKMFIKITQSSARITSVSQSDQVFYYLLHFSLHSSVHVLMAHLMIRFSIFRVHACDFAHDILFFSV